ncbi:MAG: sulfite exporter TauE/SafE family protein [Candidatus Omnitrophica bacterium]|nr:sulfite exporter TauE/SafE family protein [Candidatus Omnitrophota bacterium]
MNDVTLTSAFIIGLLHVLEPCEDKAVASIYATIIGRNTRKIVFLVMLYGFGMMIADTTLGVIAGYVGSQYLARFSKQLEIVSASFTVAFGLLVFSHTHKLESHCYAKGLNAAKGDLSMLVFGIIRGLPPCPIEMAILVMAASTKSALAGGLLVASFSFGTMISLLPFAFAIGGILTFVKHKFGEKVEHLMPKVSGIVISLIGLVMLVQAIFDKGTK